MSGTRVLVTGATGFIAGHCVAELLAHGYAVRGTVRDPTTADLAYLQALSRGAGGSLEIAEAHLEDDKGWDDAVDGCSYVWHVASPNPARVPDDENELIRPAVDGTLRVLNAAAKASSVRRVVLTSSTDAITHGSRQDSPRDRTEADWSDPTACSPYAKSKIYAERAAWEFASQHRLELATVNPGLVLGPLLRPGRTTSIEVVRQLLTHAIPATPRIGFAVTDVRDVATAHRLAMETPGAAGNRYICSAEHMWMRDIAEVLAAEFGPKGYRIPQRPLPYWLMWLIARFDPTVRLALTLVGVPQLVSSAKARRELGWTTRPVRDTIVDTANGLISYAMAHPRAK